MDRKYSESELRQKIGDKREQIVKRIMARLREEDFFKIHEISSEGNMYLDGELVESWEPFRRMFGKAIDSLIAALLQEFIAVLFEEEQAR